MPTPLQAKIDELEKKSEKRGVPRVEAQQELMTDRAKDRAAGVGPDAPNQLFHGQPNSKRTATMSGGRVGKYGMVI